ncbi:MAG: KH domain-containing protein [Erysipelotrichaceae bacterium]|nr:KH domain-containing protein [Erysipelotrichaceae bacterium]MDD3808773.1 KH domain-containing protein [Erysipelotrichaceae bacterium]
MDYAKILKTIAVGLVANSEKLEVRQMPSLDEKTVVLHVYSSQEDLGKLIGHKGVIANSIRQVMAVSSRFDEKKLDIQFESYE